MGVIKKMRRQDAIWWGKSSTTDEFGTVTWENPVQIKCRWEDKVGETRNEQGEIIPSGSTVFVDRPMKIGDKLKLGKLIDLDTDAVDAPDVDREAYAIKGFEIVPDFKAKQRLYIAYL